MIIGVAVKDIEKSVKYWEDVFGYRVDLLVEHKVVIEIKVVEALNDIHLAQILTYVKLSDCKLGMLINFNAVLI
ncbi:MAG: GxxExxY protein, partial [Chlorobi bacterium]|nr:GxxExxY protein [Chlorobiota bacterium]